MAVQHNVAVLLLSLLRVSYQARLPSQENSNSGVDTPALSPDEAFALKPAFHITAISGWLNDPGGMFEYNGYLHIFPQVFYQANTRLDDWAAPSWGHIASRDRVHWQHLEKPCLSDTSYDSNGCLTGSCFLDEDGIPMCWYTAGSGMADLGFLKQQVAMLRAVNVSDPLLRQWVKSDLNPLPISLPKGVSWSEFRDPHLPWRQGDEWLTAIGGSYECAGAQLLYGTPSLANASFSYRGLISDQVSIGQVQGTCPLAATKGKDGFSCEQYGAICKAWECPDFFELEPHGVNINKWSDQDNHRSRYAQDWYLISEVTPDYGDYALVNTTDSALADAYFENELNGTQTTPWLLEFGDIYASQTWKDAQGRRIMVGWAYETPAGCFRQCNKGTKYTEALGYQGSYYLLREVTYNPATQSLLQYPIAEYANLIEGDPLYDSDVNLGAGSSVVELNTSNQVLQSDLQAVFRIISGSATPVSFKVGAQINFNGPSHVTAFINGTVFDSNVTQAWVYIDRSNMTDTMTNGTLAGQQVPLPAAGIPADAIDFRLNTDRSHLEVYAFKGLALGTVKIYPNNTAAGNWTMSLMANVSESDAAVIATARLDHWHTCWVEDATASTPTLVNSSIPTLSFPPAGPHQSPGVDTSG